MIFLSLAPGNDISSLAPGNDIFISCAWKCYFQPVLDRDLESQAGPDNPAWKVEDDHPEDCAAGRDQFARPCGRRDVAVPDAVEGDEGPPG